MARMIQVRLEPNGEYWRACWVDSNGKRRRLNIGRLDEHSKREARVLCDRLAAELNLNPCRIDSGKVPTLGEWANRFNEQKAQSRPSTIRAYKLAEANLFAFFGNSIRLDKITKSNAADFVAALSQGRIRGDQTSNEPTELAEATICNRMRHIKAIFQAAIQQDILSRNPFSGQRSQPKHVHENDYYLSRADFAKVLAACPNVFWRALISLQRCGGLRLSEALALEWSAVDWDTRVITFKAGKTQQTRRVPMDPDFYNVMLDAFGAAEPGEVQVLPERFVCRSFGSTLHKQFRRIIRKAGLTPWADLFQNLRRNAAQDFRVLFKDPWVCTAILGHSEEVERKYYLGKVRDTDLARVTGLSSDSSLQRIMDAWPTLKSEVQQELLAIVDKAQKPSDLPQNLPQN